MNAVMTVLGLSLRSLRFTPKRFKKVTGGASVGDHRLPSDILSGSIAGISTAHVRGLLLELRNPPRTFFLKFHVTVVSG
jgi:hypothetical protein